MMDLMFLAAALAFQAATPAAPSSVPVLSECDTDSKVIAQAPAAADLHVIYSIAGAPTCYFVSYVSGGKTVRGFVFDRRAGSVKEFERERVAAEVDTFSRPIPMPAPPNAAPPEPPKPVVTAKAEPPKKAPPKATF